MHVCMNKTKVCKRKPQSNMQMQKQRNRSYFTSNTKSQASMK